MATANWKVVRMVLLSRWRRISSVLLQEIYGQSAFPQSDPRLRNIHDARRSLDVILRPYAKADNDERLRKLEDLLRRGARFGYLLFSQPSLWKFEWENARGAAKKGFTVFPALLQVTDDDGKSLERPRILEEQEVVEVAQGLM